MLGLAFTGANTKHSLMTIEFQVPGGDKQAPRMHIGLLSQQIFEIGDSGITIFD